MQFDDLQLPPEGATQKWLRQTNERDDVKITIPLSIGEEDTTWIVGAVILSDTAATFLYHDLGTWNLFTEYPLKHDYNIYKDDLLYPGVGLLHEDARKTRKAALQFGENLNDTYRIAFAPYVEHAVAQDFETARESCICSSIGDSQVKAGPGLSGIEEERVYMCAKCSKVHGLEYANRPIRKEKALDANWVLDGEPPDDFVEVGEDDGYLLYSAGEPTGKLEHVVALMSMIGGAISNSFSRYVPSEQKTLIYVRDETVLGYLTWTTEEDGRQSHQQLFVRERYRREGVASTLVETWAAEYSGNSIFYVEEPNEKSRELLKNLGFWNGDRKPEAVEHYTLRGAGNDLEEGIEMGESVSNTQSQLGR